LETSYDIRDLPGRGKGVIATRRIRRGEVFMLDFASVVADIEFPGRVKRSQGNELLSRAMEQIPNSERLLSLATSSMGATSVPEDVMRTNSFALVIGDISRMALFPKISVSETCTSLARLSISSLYNYLQRINHACNPK
jgi:hypothetical protein